MIVGESEREPERAMIGGDYCTPPSSGKTGNKKKLKVSVRLPSGNSLSSNPINMARGLH